MSIQSEMDRIRSNVQSTLGVIADTGVEVPAGANSDALPDAARALANAKQDKLTGKQGQIVSFGADGNAKAEDAKFLPLTGGTVTGQLVIQSEDTSPELIGSSFFLSGVDGTGISVCYGYHNGEPMIEFFGSEYDELVILGGIADPTFETNAANKAYVDGLAAHQATVTLTVAGWASKAQTVSVSGILKDQTKQVVDVAPADTASRDAWAKAGIWCTDPTADGKLTFTCDTVPTVAVNVRVRWQGVVA